MTETTIEGEALKLTDELCLIWKKEGDTAYKNYNLNKLLNHIADPHFKPVDREQIISMLATHGVMPKRALNEEIKRLLPPPGATVTTPGAVLYLWERLRIVKTASGMPIANLSNVVKVLTHHEDYKDFVWYDEFYQKIFTSWHTKKPREWSDADDLALTEIFQRDFGLSRIAVDTVSQGIRLVSAKNTCNEPRDWMETLQWDQTDRAEHFFHECFGAEDSEYTRQVSRNFWVSIAARTYNPGCKMDNMVVLEGAQGIGKSNALRSIGEQWYTEANESVTTKDFFMTLTGKMIVEIAELDSFNRAEVTRIKQVISCSSDRYRAPYGRSAQDHPRMSVFVGSTNEDEYLRDGTGARRFWPIPCGTIRRDLIESNRSQLFAEAVHLFKSGATWWEIKESAANSIQESRRATDPWEEILQEYLTGRADLSYTIIAKDALGLNPEKQNTATQKRIGKALRKLGWEKGRKRLFPGEYPKMVWNPASECTLDLQ